MSTTPQTQRSAASIMLIQDADIAILRESRLSIINEMLSNIDTTTAALSYAYGRDEVIKELLSRADIIRARLDNKEPAQVEEVDYLREIIHKYGR